LAVQITIRRATPADAALLAGLRYQFRSALAAPTEPEPDFVHRCTAWMALRLAEDGPWLAWVAEARGTAVGQLWLQIFEKVPNPTQEPESNGYITNVFVASAARGLGAGEALVAAAMAECRARGLDSVILWPTDRSRTLYARHGFAVRDDLMEAILDDARLQQEPSP
jgi:ribosomal protein S18 acetylase RimI-like enzyme